MNTFSTDSKLFAVILCAFATATVAATVLVKPATVPMEVHNLGQVVVTGKRADAAQAAAGSAVRLATVTITAKRIEAQAASAVRAGVAPSQARAQSLNRAV
jgi:hypothetical protein